MALTATSNGFFSRHRWLVWAAGLIAAVLLLASFMSRDDVIPVRAATVERSTIRSVISTNGKVEPLQSFEAHAPGRHHGKEVAGQRRRSRERRDSSWRNWTTPTPAARRRALWPRCAVRRLT